MRYARLLLAALVASLIASGCAGGGGGGSGSAAVSPPASPPSPPPPISPPPPTTIPSASSAEYQRNWGVAGTQAITAWQNGDTGAGVTVAVIDTGVDGSDAELVGRVSPASKDINSLRNQLFDPTDTHGSEVASVIAANFNGAKTVGVAYDSTILAVRADDGSGSFSFSDLTNAVNFAVSQGASIINLSIGGPAGSMQFQNALAAATAAGVIVVASAGNEGISGPSGPQSEVDYPAFFATNSVVSHNIIIAAGGENSNGTFNLNSNPAGQAENFYLVAPGWQVIVPQFGATTTDAFHQCFSDGTCQVQGTSYAAPHIAGALALLKQAFPGLTPQQLVQLVLISADDMGAPGVDALTGHGALDITKAFSSIGLVSAPLPGGTGEIGLGQELGVVGPAFGDAFADSQRWSVTGFDSFGRSFHISLAPSWRSMPRSDVETAAPLLWRSASTGLGVLEFAPADPAPPETARIMADPQTSAAFRSEAYVAPGLTVAFASGAPVMMSSNPAAAGSAYLAFTGDDRGASVTQQFLGGFSLALLSEHGQAENPVAGDPIERDGRAVHAGWVHGRLALGVSTGVLDEDGAALGLAWGSRWGPDPRARTRFGGLDGQMRLSPSLRLGAQIEAGTTGMNGTGWLTQATPLVTTSGAAALEWAVRPALLAELAPETSGALTFAVSQPMRVESGSFSAVLPTSDAWGRAHLTYEDRLIDAAPTGREVQTRLSYSVRAPDRLTAQVAVKYTSDPGHSASARPEAGVELGLRKTF